MFDSGVAVQCFRQWCGGAVFSAVRSGVGDVAVQCT